MEIVDKAYQVWHWGMIDENPYEGYTFDELPITYAETAGKAKYMASEPHDFNLLSGEDAEFTDLRVKRCKKMDRVKFEGRIVHRHRVDTMLKERDRVAKEMANLDKYPDDEMFYIQNGYVGNSISWWGNGYTCKIEKATKFTKDEIKKDHIVGRREEDRIWAASHVENIIVKVVDGQYLNSEYKVSV